MNPKIRNKKMKMMQNLLTKRKIEKKRFKRNS